MTGKIVHAWAETTPKLVSLKRKYHIDEVLLTDCTGSCQNDNFPCSQWRKFRQNDIHVAVIERTESAIETEAKLEPKLEYKLDMYFKSRWLCCALFRCIHSVPTYAFWLLITLFIFRQAEFIFVNPGLYHNLNDVGGSHCCANNSVGFIYSLMSIMINGARCWAKINFVFGMDKSCWRDGGVSICILNQRFNRS